MNGISYEKKSMASLSVFSILYKEQKDIYYVIGEFLKLSLQIHQVHTETTLDILKKYICEDYGISIPEAVLRTSINRLNNLIKVEKRRISILEEFDTNIVKKTADEIRTEEEHNSEIITQLITYIEKRQGRSLNSTQKKDIETAFCAYMVDDQSTSEYSQEIYLYLLSKEHDAVIVEQLNQIRDGVLMYVAFSYQTSANQIDTLSNELTIFLETEILFSAAGYNGTIHQELFDDFYALIEEINSIYRKRHGKNIINLRYFEESRIETDGYFVAAESLIRENKVVDRNRSAMSYIIDHCTECYDVQLLKTEFYSLLKKKGIELDNHVDYYSEPNRVHNIDFVAIKNTISIEGDDTIKLDNCLELLNKISIRRANRPQNFFNGIGYLLLSGKSLTLMCAQGLCTTGNVPLATSIWFLTNRFWCMLHKSIAIDGNLRSFNVITRAKIALSSTFKNSLSQNFLKVKEEFAKGLRTKEEVEQYIASVQIYRSNPEDLDPENIEAIDKLSNSSIDNIIAEQIKKEEEAVQKISEQQKRLEQLENEKSSLIQEKDIMRQSYDEQSSVFISALVGQEQKEADQRWDKEYEEWTTNQKNFCRIGYKNEFKSSSFYVLIQLGVLMTTVTLLLLPIWIPEKSILFYIVATLAALLQLFFSLWFDKSRFVRHFRFLLCHSYRIQFHNNLIQEYQQLNQEPKREIITLEKIREKYTVK